MELCHDFKELLELFNAQKVEYIIVGGYALAFHGAPPIPVILTFLFDLTQKMPGEF